MPAPSGISDGGAWCDVMLWVDRLGCFRLIGQDQVVLGSPGRGGSGPDLEIMAPLSRLQALIMRSGEHHCLLPAGPAGQWAESQGRLLRAGETFLVGGTVQLQYQRPSPLSRTAVLRMASAHRFVPRLEGAILMDQVCQLGPGSQSHLRDDQMSMTTLIFRRGGRLWCRTAGTLEHNGQNVGMECPLSDGDIVSGEGVRFRVEFAKPAQP